MSATIGITSSVLEDKIKLLQDLQKNVEDLAKRQAENLFCDAGQTSKGLVAQGMTAAAKEQKENIMALAELINATTIWLTNVKKYYEDGDSPLAGVLSQYAPGQ